MTLTCCVPSVMGLLGAMRLVPLPALRLTEEAAWLLSQSSTGGGRWGWGGLDNVGLSPFLITGFSLSANFIILSEENSFENKYLSGKLCVQ